MALFTDTPPKFGHPLIRLAEATARRALRLRRGKNLSEMQKLDDSLLRDIGFSRDQVNRTAGTRWSRDVADELHRLSLTRRGPWM